MVNFTDMLTVDRDVDQAIDALENRTNAYGYDAWGFSPAVAKRGYTFGKRVFLPYFRPTVTGIENLPPGRVMIVGNHSGQVPIDGAIVALACLLNGKPPRLVRAMVERWFPNVPFISDFLFRCGAVLGDPVNCRNLLLDEQSILVFPEGVRGSSKTWKKRYQLAEFGRGFMRLALQTDTPIVPCAIIGGEESIVSLYNAKTLAKWTGVPYFPITPFTPFLGPFGYMPLPVKFRIHFGKPLTFSGRYDDEDSVINEKADVIKSQISKLIEHGLAERKSVFY